MQALSWLILYFFSGPTLIKCWKCFHGLPDIFTFSIYTQGLSFITYFCHISHALRLLMALCLLIFSNFQGPKFIPCPTYIPDSRETCVKQPDEISDIFYEWPLSKFHLALHNIQRSNSLYKYWGSPPYVDFWAWKKNILGKICISGTLGVPLLTQKSPNCTYISKKQW